MQTKSFVFVCALVMALSLAGGPGWAASTGSAVSSSSNAPQSADFTAGKKAAMDGDFQAAVDFFSKVADTDPTNADNNNMLGFSYRKLGNVEKAFEFYKAALDTEPDHIGANEYIGELYLELGDLANAEKHLKVLDQACFFGCDAYTDLKIAIKKYKTQEGS